MGPRVTFLFSIGLCLHWRITAQLDSLPRPRLWAVPSPVVPKEANMTLRCQGHLGTDRFQLWKDRDLLEEKNTSWGMAEFVLTSVDDGRDARNYSCRCVQGSLWSELSDPLDLVVTGFFAEPTILVSHNYPVYSSTRVTIWCDLPPQTQVQDYTFALLEAKSLEPLKQQSPVGTRAAFLFPSVRPEDTGSYKCIYYRKTAPYRGSIISKAVEVTVHGPLPKPTLLARPGLVMATGANITLWCSRPKLSSLGEVTFILWRTVTHVHEQPPHTSEDLWASFLLPSLRPEDTGSYSCTYRESTHSFRVSEQSDALEIMVAGSLPQPSLTALPGVVVETGTHVTLQCRLPHQSSIFGVTFMLFKVGIPQTLQSQRSAGTSADFPLLSVRAQDAGNYSCVYHGSMTPRQVSEPSDVLEIWVTDALPKPSLSAWTGPGGDNVNFLCRGPSLSTRVLLHKNEERNIPYIMDATPHGAQFFLTPVTPKDSGNYSCSYQVSTNGSYWTQHSDPLQLIVGGTVPSNTLIIALSCVSFLLLFCLVLLMFLCHGSIPTGSLQGDSPRRYLSCPCIPWTTCLPHHHETHREEAMSVRMAKERSNDSLVKFTKEPQGVTYAQLNINSLNEKKSGPTRRQRDSIIYATVSKE